MNSNKAITPKINRFLSITLFIICLQSLEAFAFPDDSTIIYCIESDLRSNPLVSSHLVDVRVDSGFVTLSGTVSNLLSRDLAEKTCFSIKGVRGIINRLGVIPIERSETEIRNDASMALLQNSATEKFELTPHVSGDTVTLQGTVQSIAEKNIAEQVVKGVKGIRVLINKISVVPVENRLDEDIQKDIQHLIKSDPYVYDKMVTVSVKNGIVFINGTVGSFPEKLFARNNAYVKGARAVVDSGLHIKLWANDPLRRKGKIIIRSDSVLLHDLHMLFRKDPRIAPFEISTSVQEGNITLTGIVDNMHSRRQAAETALNVVGVYTIENRIKVRPTAFVDDKEIEKKIHLTLNWDPFLDRHDLDITVRNGKAYLYGMVDSRFEKEHATEVIEPITGIAEIANYINVRDKSGYNDNLTDNHIKNCISDAYTNNWFVDESSLNVKVNDAIATVSGRITSNKELTMIIDKAFDCGAEVVITRCILNGRKMYGSFDYRDGSRVSSFGMRW